MIKTHLAQQQETAKAGAPPSSNHRHKSNRLKVAYIMSRFPKITETFILYEMLAMQREGIDVEVYPLIRERTKVMHPEAKQFVDRAHFQTYASGTLLKAHLYFLRHKPAAYLGALWTLLRANWGSTRFLTRAVGLFPKAVSFARSMKADGVEHIHAHFASHPAAAAFVIHRLAGIPFSFTAHGSDLHRDRHMLPEKVAEAKFVVAISEYNKDIIINDCGESFKGKVAVIHCGVDTKFFQPRLEITPFERGDGPFSVLCIGTLHEVKGQTYLIQACKQIQDKGADFVCHFIGDGPDEDDLKAQVAEAGLTECVRFHGRLTRDEIAVLLSQADAVATPSVPTSDGRREGIPVVIMEAMGSSVPVVASNLSGIPELVVNGSTGLLVEPRDISGLADALYHLYTDSELRQRLGQAGRKKVVAEFDLYENAALLADRFDREIVS